MKGKNNRQLTLSEEFETSSGFSLSELHSLTSYAKKRAYCKEKLENVGVGTSRAVFALDNEKVLKLAINKKGIAQNEVEWDSQHYNSPIVPEIYDVDDDSYWIIMQRAVKCKPADFKKINGYSLDDAFEYLSTFFYGGIHNLPEEIVERIQEGGSYVMEVMDLYHGYDIEWKDLIVARNMGIVFDDDGDPYVVCVDLGANKSVIQDFYSESELKEGQEVFINKKTMAKKTVLVTKSELAALLENVVLRKDGVKTKSRPIKASLNESTSKGRQIIKLTESDLSKMVDNIIATRDKK